MTPTTRDWKDGACADSNVPTNGLLGRQAVRAWATPTASDGMAENLTPGVGQRARGPQNLMECAAAANWPTPDAGRFNDGEELDSWLARREQVKAKWQNGNGMGTPLSIAVRLPETWPTATAGDANGSGSAGYSTKSGRSEGTTLTDAAVRRIWAGEATESKSIKGVRLNPAWVEQLMGFPPGWTWLDPAKPKPTGKRPASPRRKSHTAQTDSAPSATRSSRKSGSSSGGG